jgi:Ca-activated chloride channel family protein
MAGELQLSVQTNKTSLLTTEGQQLVYVLIEAMPTGEVANVQMPLNFSLVLDHSGSMSGAKLADLKEAAKLAVDQMGPQDLISIVVFDDKVETIAPSQPVTDVAALKQQIDRIRNGGGTEMSGGMRRGLEELRQGLSADRVSRMLLLTDGETYGDEDICRSLAVEAGEQAISIAALGLGEQWNEQLMDDIAQASNGISDFVAEGQPDAILSTFRQQVQVAQATVVQNANMILRLVTGVTPRAVWRVQPLISRLGHQALSDRDVQVALGDVDRERGQGILIELQVSPRQPGTYRIAQAEMSYDVAARGLAAEKTKADVILDFTADPDQAARITPYVMNIVEKVTAHTLQTRALDEAAVGNVAGATQKLRAAATRLLELGEDELARTAQEEAERLEQGEGLSARGTKKLRYETRKLTQKLLDR